MTRHLLHHSPTFQSPVILTLIGLIYFLLGKFGLMMALPDTNVSPIWPASGLALAATLLLGYKTLIPIFCASTLLNILAFWHLTGNDISRLHAILFGSMGIGLGAALQAYAGTVLIHYFIKDVDYFNSPANTLKFLILGLLSCIINSNIGTLSTVLAGIIPWESYVIVWWTWFVGDTGGVFTTAPLILCWLRSPFKNLKKGQVFEIFVVLAAIATTSWLNRDRHAHITYMYFAWLTWSAIRFPTAITTAILFLTVFLSIFETIHGYGPFHFESHTESLIYLELFIILLTSLILLLVSELNFHRKNQSAWVKVPKVNRSQIPSIAEKVIKWFKKTRK